MTRENWYTVYRLSLAPATQGSRSVMVDTHLQFSGYSTLKTVVDLCASGAFGRIRPDRFVLSTVGYTNDPGSTRITRKDALPGFDDLIPLFVRVFSHLSLSPMGEGYRNWVHGASILTSKCAPELGSRWMINPRVYADASEGVYESEHVDY